VLQLKQEKKNFWKTDIDSDYRKVQGSILALTTKGAQHERLLFCFVFFYFVFCNIFVTGFPVKFGLLSPGRARQRQFRAYPGRGNRTLSMVEETGVPGGNHRYMIRAENPFYSVQHI
jgi:hypothetical protein